MIKFIFRSLLLCCFLNICFANTPSQRLQEQLSLFHSMTANFEQVIVNQDGTPLQKTVGKIAILRPGRFRWEVIHPLPQIIVTEGQKLFIYQPDLEQVMIRHLNHNVGEIPALLLTDTHVDLELQFSIQQITPEKFILIPKKQQEIFQKIILEFVNDVIVNMELDNQLGQKTKIHFSNVKINQDLSPQLFMLKIPKGVDVIRDGHE